MVKKSYYPTLLQHLYAFEILADGITVGYYMCGFKRIILAECPNDLGDLISDLSDYCYSLHIKYIAIAKEYQRCCIGTHILKLIILQVQRLCKTWPVRLITLDALKERVAWYKSNGFKLFSEEDMRNSKKDAAMYLDCIAEPERLEQYLSEFGSV